MTSLPGRRFGNTQSHVVNQVVVTLLDGQPISAPLLEEYSNYCIEYYKVRVKNDDILQLDLEFSQDTTAGLAERIRLIRGEWTFADAAAANRLCSRPLIEALRQPENASSARSFLQYMCCISSVPEPICSMCDESCFAGIILCAHCLPAQQGTPSVSTTRYSKMRAEFQYPASEDDAIASTDDAPQLNVRHVCGNCRARYRCPLVRTAMTTRSSSVCKHLVYVARFTLESLFLLLYLAGESIYGDDVSEQDRQVKLMQISSTVGLMSQRSFRPHDIVDFCGSIKTATLQWQKSFDTSCVRTCIDQPNEQEPLYQPIKLNPRPSRMRSDFSWIYYWLGLIRNCEVTCNDTEPLWWVAD